jgi:hypothetical protein
MSTENYKYLFSIFDDITKLYEPPFVDINKGSAMRRIQDLMQSNPQSPYAKFPDNFKLMCIGTWNEETANVYTDGADHVVELVDITSTKE